MRNAFQLFKQRHTWFMPEKELYASEIQIARKGKYFPQLFKRGGAKRPDLNVITIQLIQLREDRWKIRDDVAVINDGIGDNRRMVPLHRDVRKERQVVHNYTKFLRSQV